MSYDPLQKPGDTPPPPPPTPPSAIPPPPPSPAWSQPGQPPSSPGPATGDLDPKIGSLLAYLFVWVGGLVLYLTQKDQEVRFHAAQSVALFGGLSILTIVLRFIPFVGGFLGLLVSLAFFVLWIYMSIQGYQQNHLKLPIVGDLAEQYKSR